MTTLIQAGIRIVVELPADRRNLGTLTVIKDGTTLRTFTAYGKADNATAAKDHDKQGNPKKPNPGRDPLQPHGDTPTGDFEVPHAVTTGAPTRDNSHSYGPNGALVLSSDGRRCIDRQRKRANRSDDSRRRPE